MSEYHTPVLLNQSVSALFGPADGVYADATFGGGGHSAEILARLSPQGRLIAFDRDPDALKNCPGTILSDPRFTLVRDNFRFIDNYTEWYLRKTSGAAGKGACGRRTAGKIGGSGNGNEATWNELGINGIIADLGVSSHQFDTPERGFSFRFDAPLDMRMDPENQKITAADIVGTRDEAGLAAILALYGEVPNAKSIAALIVKARAAKPITTTLEFNAVLAPALPATAEHKTLAKIYQALRIEVNGEMRNLEKFLLGAADALLRGGRLVVITYHSLEDRMVKNFIRTGNTAGEQRKDLYGNAETPLRPVLRKPLIPDGAEIASNTRARSAKLRVAEKIN